MQLSYCSSLEGKTSGGDELFEDVSEFGVSLVAEGLLGSDGVENVWVLGLDMLKEEAFELLDLGGLDLVEETSNTGVEDANLLLSNHGNVLLLLQEFSELLTSV